MPPTLETFIKPRLFAAGVSRKLAKAIPFRPHRLALDAPIVSFSFDDFPLSAAENAAPLLEAAGMRGTFYLSTGLLGTVLDGKRVADAPAVRRLHAAGHEIGAHTHDHLNVQSVPVPALAEDITRNIAAIGTLTDTPTDPTVRAPISFAYPYGVTALGAKRMLAGRFAGLRGIQPGVNAGAIDLAHLRGQELYDRTSALSDIAALLDETERRSGWLIFYTHDVVDRPSAIGCSTDYFGQTVDLVRKRGLAVQTVAATLAMIGASGG
ncbi:MAG: polysaccharide deacetylase family protein [Pseudomonadota bacterium]